MAGVLIRMKLSVLRHAWRGGQSSLLWSGATIGLLLAIGTVASVISVPVERAIDTLAIAFGLWAAAWLILPVVGGTGGDPLRPENFRLLAIPPRRLAVGLLAAGGVGVMPAVSAVAFASLVIVAVRLDAPSVIVATVAVVLTLALVVTVSRVVVAALGRAMETRLGLELAAIQYALIVALALFWIPLIVASSDGGGDPILAIGLDPGRIARLLPSGWGVVAVDAAGRSQWTLVLLALGGLVILIGLLAWAWSGLVRRRLELSPGPQRTGRLPLARLPMDVPGRGLLAATPRNGVVARELRSWARHPRRALELRVAIWCAVLLAILPALLGSTVLWPWAGAIVVVIAGNGLANVYGMDGTSFWLTLAAPNAARIDVRGRQLAWLVVVGTIGVAATLVLTFASGHLEASPWIAAILPALLGGAAGLGIFLAVATPAPLPERRGGDPLDLGDDPTTGGNLMLHGIAMSLLVPVLAIPALLATAVLPVLGLPVGVATGLLYAWLGGAVAIRRLERAGPETLERLRSRPAPPAPVSEPGADSAARLPRWRSIARNVLLLAGALLIFAQGITALVLKLSGSDAKVWFAALYLPEPWPVPAAAAAVLLGAAAWIAAWRIGRRASRKRVDLEGHGHVS